jgi:molecular chaperone GrpE
MSEDAKFQESTEVNSELSLIEEAKQQTEKYKNDFLYLKAEFENYKRNQIKERSEMIKYGSERLLSDILGVVDNFDRALSAKVDSQNLDSYIKGVEMTAKELKAVLGKFGVAEIPAEGQVFNPMTHEALSSEPRADVEPGVIVRVLRKPYKLHDRTIRIGQVVVSKTPEAN